MTTKIDTAPLAEIAGLLDGQAWNPDTLDAIAEIVRRAGFTVRDVDEAASERKASADLVRDVARRVNQQLGAAHGASDEYVAGRHCVVVWGPKDSRFLAGPFFDALFWRAKYYATSQAWIDDHGSAAFVTDVPNESQDAEIIAAALVQGVRDAIGELTRRDDEADLLKQLDANRKHRRPAKMRTTTEDEGAAELLAICPFCGSADLQYLEDIGNGRALAELQGDGGVDDKPLLVIESEYKTFDEGSENCRLMCNECDQEFNIPESWDVDWQ